MNQWFYNIAGGIVDQIRCEKRKRNQKWLFAVSEIFKQNRNWLYFNFSVESSSFIFNNFETEEFKLTFKGWHKPVCHLFGFTRLSFCKILFHFTLGQWSESWRRCWRVSFSFCLRFRTNAESLFVSIIVAKYNIFPALTMAACVNKNSGEAICSRHQRALSGFWARLRILNLIPWLC